MTHRQAYRPPNISKCKEMYGYVYLTTCKLDASKCYVGLRHGCPDYGYVGSGLRLGYCIKKYGLQNFEAHVLETCCNKKDLLQAEIDWIAILRSVGAGLLNINAGGEGVGVGKDNPRFGTKLTEEHKAAIRGANTGRPRTEAQMRVSIDIFSKVRLTKAQRDQRKNTILQRYPDWNQKMKLAAETRPSRKGMALPGQSERIKQSWIVRKQKSKNGRNY